MNTDNLTNIGVGICGCGTVGGGTFTLLQDNADELQRRLGFKISLAHIATRTPKPQYQLEGVPFSSDVMAVTSDPNVHIVVETMGGYDLALKLVMAAIDNGKHVVTANKALIAEHGSEILKRAQHKGVIVAFESAVAGGIPIIKALREGLAGNSIEWLGGIINGTGNFILTEMSSKQRQFADVLAQAQQLGYAEADPTFDVEGIDAAHKLTIMAAIAFGTPLNFAATYTEGISKITPEDLVYAKQLGYRVKHLGIARKTAKGVEVRVHPTLIPEEQLLAHVDGVENAVVVHGNAVGSTLYSGPGAGAGATASSVVADIIDIGRLIHGQFSGPLIPALAFAEPDDQLAYLPIDEIESEYYLRISVKHKVGVMAQISAILHSCDISIDAVIQKEAVSDSLPIVLLTQKALEARMNKAIAEIEALPEVEGEVMRIRLELLSAD